MAKKRYQRMTAEEQAARLERRRFADEVIRKASEAAGIPNTREARREYASRVVAETWARQRREAATDPRT